MPTITNAGPGPIRWTLRRASSEFGISIPTLVARLNEADQTSAEDKTFTTKQLIESLFGSVHQERLAKLKAEREYTELQTGILRADFVPVQELTRILSEVANGMKQLIRASKLDRTGQDDLLCSLAGTESIT